jgi:hypothetical protein
MRMMHNKIIWFSKLVLQIRKLAKTVIRIRIGKKLNKVANSDGLFLNYTGTFVHFFFLEGHV